MTGSRPVLECSGIDKSFTLPTGDRLNILHNLDLRLEPGEVIAVIGRSGSGKSTLLNILGLLDAPTTGTCHVDGVDVSRLSDTGRSQLRGQFLGFIFQQFHLMDRRTALENVDEPLLYATPIEIATRHRRASEVIDQVGLAERAHSMPHLLSGGEQQRVAIARALVRKPRLVLADEPTGSLDEVPGELVLDLLFDLVRSEEVTMVLVTHDSGVARRADRVLTLEGGKLHGEMTA